MRWAAKTATLSELDPVHGELLNRIYSQGALVTYDAGAEIARIETLREVSKGWPRLGLAVPVATCGSLTGIRSLDEPFLTSRNMFWGPMANH